MCPGTICRDRIPLGSEARGGLRPLPGPSLRLWLPVGSPGSAVAAVPVVVAAGGSRETVTPLFCKLFLTACLFRVEAGAGTVWKCDSLFNVAAH